MRMDYDLAESLMGAGFPQIGKGSLIGPMNKLVWRRGDRAGAQRDQAREREPAHRHHLLMARASKTMIARKAQGVAPHAAVWSLTWGTRCPLLAL